MSFRKPNSRGFTLLEILLVVGIIAILAGIVIVAINPSKQLAQVRNTQRISDLKQLNNAITQYYIDNSSYPSTISTTTLNEVCNTGSVASTTVSINNVNCATAGLANLSTLVPKYLTAIPTDPTGTSSLLAFIPTAYAATTATGTGYKVGISATKKVLLSAPLSELGVTVSIGNLPTVASCSPTPTEWSDNQGAKNWTAAGAACVDLGSCWRLPTVDELTAGLTAQFLTSPPTVTGFAENSSYWSGTEYGEDSAWNAYYNNDTVVSYGFNKGVGLSVRCVR